MVLDLIWKADIYFQGSFISAASLRPRLQCSLWRMSDVSLNIAIKQIISPSYVSEYYRLSLASGSVLFWRPWCSR